MESNKYGFNLDHILRKGNPFDALGATEDPFGTMEEHIDNADHFDPDEMYMHPDDMYMDPYDLDPTEMLAGMSDEQREELLRQYQYYEQTADDPGIYAEDYGYYDDQEYDDQHSEEYSNYYDEYTRISLSELCDRCVFPTLSQAIQTLYPLLGLCLFTRFTLFITSEVLQGMWGWYRSIHHCTSTICGLLALYLFFEESLSYLCMLAMLAYVLLYLTCLKCRSWSGITVAFVTVVYLITCELFLVHQTVWHRIRGAQMVLSMKIISIGFDLDTNALNDLPGPLEYSGYVFNVGTVIFGPWISFTEYSNSLLYKDRKITFYWVAKCIKSGAISLLFVIGSTCIVHWLILDEEAFILFLVYRDAQSFRFSHYFISYASELTATLCGLGATKTNSDVRWDLAVARPFHIELPRSLVDVVSNWNLPMHFWLKTYVFKTAKPLGNFAAVLLTYAASSILHGLNFQLAAVLLSLGFYSYIEFVLRRWLSRLYDACVQAKACKEHCDHKHTQRQPYVLLVNLGLGLLAMFHLAYLGVLFDSSTDEEQGYSMSHTLQKWAVLGYASHWIALATYIFYMLI